MNINQATTALTARGSAAFLQRLGAVLLTVTLCLGLMPSLAWAQEGDVAGAAATEAAEANVVTLTVTAGSSTDLNTGNTSFPTWVNKQYTLDEVLKATRDSGSADKTKANLTMEDLLKVAVAKGDLKTYDASASSYGSFLNSITSKDGSKLAGWNNDDSSMSQYWSVYDNGSFASSSFDQVKLVGGNAYQLCWSTFTSAVAPSDWPAYYKVNAVEQAKNVSGEVIPEVATLTITAGSSIDYDTGDISYPTWVNKQYALDEMLKAAQAAGKPNATKADLTMEDLLLVAVDKGDLKAYDASLSSRDGKSLNSLTSKSDAKLAAWNSADFSASLYWATFDNTAYASTTFDKVKLVEGGTYQLCWDSFSTAAAPSDWKAYYVANPVTKAEGGSGGSGGSGGDAGDKVDPPTDTYTADGINDNDVATLMGNIAASYQGTTDAWQVLDLAAAARLSSAEAQAFIPVALEGMKNPSADSGATALQRNIIALSAAGVDASAIPDKGSVYNAVDAMAQKVSAASPVNVLAFTLLAYASGSYQVPENAKISKDALIAELRNRQLSDGGFAFNGARADADITAMVVTALAPYVSQDASLQNVVNKALAALKGLQHADGGFGASGFGVEAGTNANSTAVAIIALCATGINPATSWATESGATPVSALLSQATSSLEAFVYGGNVNESATEQGFRALVAYQGLKNTDAAYNIYMQAKDGQAKFSGIKKQEQEQEKTSPIASTLNPSKNALATTSDSTVPFVVGMSAAALSALVAGVLATRRLRAERETLLRR